MSVCRLWSRMWVVYKHKRTIWFLTSVYPPWRRSSDNPQPTSPTNIQTQNNIQQQINIINLNNFGSETHEHITNKYSTECVLHKSIGLVNYIKAIPFNEQVPENRTLRLKSKKQVLFEKYVDGQWVVCDKNQTLDQIIEQNRKHLYIHFINNKDTDNSIQENEWSLRQSSHRIDRCRWWPSCCFHVTTLPSNQQRAQQWGSNMRCFDILIPRTRNISLIIFGLNDYNA
jgi:hypothetical protein